MQLLIEGQIIIPFRTIVEADTVVGLLDRVRVSDIPRRDRFPAKVDVEHLHEVAERDG
jgi:hypothetical protein